MKTKTLSSKIQLSVLGSAFAVSALLAAACQSTEPRELGYTQTDQGFISEPAEPFFSSPDEFVGRWIGSANDPLAFGDENTTYTFPSGSQQFVLDVRLISDGFGGETVTGTLTFGAGEPLPPPTDPDAGYPVGLSYTGLLEYESPGLLGNPDTRLPPFEGAPYALDLLNAYGSDAGLQLPDGLLMFGFNVNQPLDPWCQLQTPYESPDAPGLYQCYENFGGQFELNPDGTGASCPLYGPVSTAACPEDPTIDEFLECLDVGEPVAQINCDKLFLCAMNQCQCDEFSCSASALADNLVLRREGDELVGVFAGTTFLNVRNMKTPLGEVRFQRVD